MLGENNKRLQGIKIYTTIFVMYDVLMYQTVLGKKILNFWIVWKDVQPQAVTLS
jgi:hypothetical protein